MENVLTDPDLSLVESGNLKVIIGPIPRDKFISFTVSKNEYVASSLTGCSNLIVSVIISEKK